MKIKSIHIRNVRGLGDRKIELNMIPNKPSLLVAPNGSGKSSFAFAFQWLNRQRMKLSADDAYMGDEENKPCMIIETDDPSEIFVADETKNEISRKFGIYVINSGLTAIPPGIHGGFQMGKAHITVPEIVLIDHIPQKKQLTDDFEEAYELTRMPKGYYPIIQNLLDNNSFMVRLNAKDLKCTSRVIKKIKEFIERSKEYTGTINERHNKIEQDDYDLLNKYPIVSTAINYIKGSYPRDRNAMLLLRAIRLLTLYYRQNKAIEDRIEYVQYKSQEKACRDLFKTLRNTWKNIEPHREKDKLSLQINDVQRISNGERDIMVFIANLYKAKGLMTKDNNILIIDEVFDYLDDANMMAAQFYITDLIKQLKGVGKNIFPVILSHLNPDYYNQHYSFKDLKVYYLCPLPQPHASDNMIKLLRQRKALANAGENSDDISKYMLHYHNDYSQDISGKIGTCPAEWGNIDTFKKYCNKQMDNYLDNEEYDPLAVCVALREIIESRVYSCFTEPVHRNEFIEIHGTQKKLNYADEQGIDVPEIYYLLGNIYNDPMHVDNKSNKLITQTLYSRLENATVRNMIKTVKDNRI